VFTLSLKEKWLRRGLVYLISFSAGALLGDVFLHLLPEISSTGLTVGLSAWVLAGVGVFFVMEKVLRWEHCHGHVTDEHVHEFAKMNLVGDGVHNLLDGLVIAASYMVSIPAGIATTVAVGLHEIPQEIGDFGVLLHGGFSRGKALMLNFASGLLALVGALVGLWLGSEVSPVIVALAAGGFIYIAGSDLLPELHKHSDDLRKNLGQIVALALGVGVMFLLL
jgi:zinc and cadmium transporter